MKWLSRSLLGRRYRRTTLVAVFCASVLVGIAMARFIDIGAGMILLSLALFVGVLRFQRGAALLSIILLGMTIGGWRGAVYMQRLAQYEPLYGTKVVLVGEAVDDAGYGKQKQLSFDLKKAYVDGDDRRLIGKIGVSGFGANTIRRGDVVQVSGKIRPGLGSKQAFMSFATLTVVREHQNTPIDSFRRNFAAGMLSAIPEPEASFAMGILIGQKATLPDDVYDNLTKVGLVHIIAVSGYNLTIIMRAVMKLLGKRSKYQSFIVAISLICVFLLITGFGASIVRASIVSGLSMIAWYYGRSFRPIVLILLAAAITSLANPLYPWGDIGWYLSFLAFYGVLILAPQARERFMTGWFKNSVLFGILLESLAAEIMTLPLILYIFGQMSAVSLLANVVVAAFVPAAMLLSLVAGLAGLLIPALAGWLAWPATLVLTYMLDAARILASVPHNFHENWYMTAWMMISAYVIVVVFNVLLYRRVRRNKSSRTLLREENVLLKWSPASQETKYS